MHIVLSIIAMAILSSAPCLAIETTENTETIVAHPISATSLLQETELRKIKQAFEETGLVPEKFIQLRVMSYTSPHPDAFLNSEGAVLISSGLLNHIHSTDELAFVLAHELAHRAIGLHVAHNESEADAHALQLLSSAGYDTAAAVTLLNRICSAAPVSMRSRPGLVQRVTRLQKASATLTNKSLSITERAEIITDSTSRIY